MDPRDFALQHTMPTVMVPKFGAFERLQNAGHRLLMASNGVWIEAKRPGIYSRLQLADALPVVTPYGAMTDEVTLGFQKIGSYVQQFVDYARSNLPHEVAMALIYNESEDSVRFVTLPATSSSSAHITYAYPELGNGEHVVMDIHSHAEAPAFFSSLDNADDRGDVKVAIVVGKVDSSNPQIKARLCTMGRYLPLPVSFTENDQRTQPGGSHVTAHNPE